MAERFILVYIAVILGVATYFYLRKKLREGRERREEKRRLIPTVYYVYEATFDEDWHLLSVHLSFKEAEEARNTAEKLNEDSFMRYGIMREDKKLFRKREDA